MNIGGAFPEPDHELINLEKEATIRKSAKDWDGAIDCLKRARLRMASNEGVGYSMDAWLRLPLFLQQGGRFDEAWSEFSALLSDGYPRQLWYEDSAAFELSTLCDKMRLALQREKLPACALVATVWQMMASRRGLSLLALKDRETREPPRKAELLAVFEEHLRKLKIKGNAPALTGICIENSSADSWPDFDSAREQVQSLHPPERELNWPVPSPQPSLGQPAPARSFLAVEKEESVQANPTPMRFNGPLGAAIIIGIVIIVCWLAS